MSTNTFSVISAAEKQETLTTKENLEKSLNDIADLARQERSRLVEMNDTETVLFISFFASRDNFLRHIEMNKSLICPFVEELVRRGCQKDAAKDLTHSLFHETFMSSLVTPNSKAVFKVVRPYINISCEIPVESAAPSKEGKPVVAWEAEYTADGWILNGFDKQSKKLVQGAHSVKNVFSLFGPPRADGANRLH